MVLLRIKNLNLGLSEEEHRAFADRFIQDANDVSGDIVLRAAKRGRNASELMGIVLSRYLLRNELGLDRLYGWYFLDDYADWLGQREEQIADILAVSPEVTADGQFRLAVLITKSKYIDSSAVTAKRKESQKQLRDTMKRVYEAVFGSPQRLDRELWLARLSDLYPGRCAVSRKRRVNLSDWRRAIREGACGMAVRGYSHVFVSDPNDAAECSAFCRVTDLEDAYQEVFGRSDIRELTLRYFRGEDPLPVRRRVSGEDIWTGLDFVGRRTAPLVPPRRRGRREHGDGDDLPPGPPSEDSPPTPPVGSDSGTTAPNATPEEGESKPAILSGAEYAWAFPGVSTLLRPEEASGADVATKEWLRRTVSTAKHALQQFHLQARLLQSTLTPNCGLLRFAGSANLTVEQVNRRRSELLTTYGLNVVSVRPEAGAVTIGVARTYPRGHSY